MCTYFETTFTKPGLLSVCCQNTWATGIFIAAATPPTTTTPTSTTVTVTLPTSSTNTVTTPTAITTAPTTTTILSDVLPLLSPQRKGGRIAGGVAGALILGASIGVVIVRIRNKAGPGTTRARKTARAEIARAEMSRNTISMEENPIARPHNSEREAGSGGGAAVQQQLYYSEIADIPPAARGAAAPADYAMPDNGTSDVYKEPEASVQAARPAPAAYSEHNDRTAALYNVPLEHGGVFYASATEQHDAGTAYATVDESST